MVKSYLEANKVNERIKNATGAPSTRTSPSSSMGFNEVDLDNPDHLKWLKEDPKRVKEYQGWLGSGGSKSLSV